MVLSKRHIRKGVSVTETERIHAVAVRAARAAGGYLVSRMDEGRPLHASEKGLLDYVTEADRQSETIIRDIIASMFPTHSILAEEGGQTGDGREDLWVVDPLDGTVNYMSSFPFFSVSIGFVRGGVVEVGVVYDPVRDELFSAVRGGGAFLNGEAIRANDVSDLRASIVITGFNHRVEDRVDPFIASLRGICAVSAGIRRVGSAALDLCWTAAGRADGFWEPGLSPWDIAAGSLILTEAGGVVTDFSGKADYLTNGDVLAAPAGAHRMLLSVIRKAFDNSGDV
jgi:myo-inositol-1(or 4)-monophosphatase